MGNARNSNILRPRLASAWRGFRCALRGLAADMAHHDPHDGRLRGRRGVKQRARRLAAEPLCRDCVALGLVVPAAVPDHIVPLAQGGKDEDDNIRCLCAEHHLKRTAEQFGLRYRAPVGADGWPL
ncbi:HNH endonuclease signature motif containing protein [Aureimonas sp. AU22]|uniref:HNH endonuclease signature motif containing protein n=1 Tax=Aureimonas sp. AU22 TaxID=1638162 RepID=UPI0009E81062